ncbi:MAG: hypothetical protein LDL31_02940 [Prosthecobacter sp.]|nr:hypothetical protein [Prosthecobacter sp.]
MSSPGRAIRLALVLFPLGLILTSILSFGIWWQKRQAAEERTFAHASALRREMTETTLGRHAEILREVLANGGPERLSAVASYLDSSMSPENMGYEPRRERFMDAGQEQSTLEVELTGKQRPREVRLLLVPYGDRARLEAEALSLAGAMTLFHSLAGERAEDTLRLAAVPLGVRDAEGLSALQRIAAGCTERRERVLRLWVAGGVDEAVLAEVRAAFRVEQTGTVVAALPASKSLPEALRQMAELKERL